MTLPLTLLFLSLILSPLTDLAWKHWRAYRRAKQDIFPPRRTIEATIDDRIPF